MDPPRGFSTHKLIMGAHLLSEAGADVINVADSPMARMRMSPWAVCQLIQNEVGVESVLHFPTRGRNLLRVQGDLLAAHALGVRNVFVVMGDPTAIGDYPEAMDDYDLVPSGLIKLIKHGFNTGVDHAGADIGEATSFFIGTALNLGAKDVGREIRLLRKKMTAGADFALTQPVYEARTVERFLKAYQSEFGPLDLPILVGLLPLYNHRHAAFLHNEVPGIDIPTSIRDRIDAAGEDSAAEGVRVAIELMDEMRDMVQGVYLMPPFSRYDLAAEIIEAIRAEN
jgi:homocysteine S-methyltransferase